MGNVIGIMAESGMGKTTAIENLPAEHVGIFNCSKKRLPVRKKFPYMAMTGNYETIKRSLRENRFNCYVLDDIGLTMAFFLFDHVNESGYAKFTQLAKSFYDLIQCAINETSDDTNIFFLMHVERSDDGMRIKMKTSGKMIDSQLTLESLFPIVLYGVTDGKKHVFITQSDGVTTAKSPKDMFPLEIRNDLELVDRTVREYYDMAPIDAVKPKAKPDVEVEKKKGVGGNANP